MYAYDANGNMLNGAGRALTWDADNRLAAVTIQGGNSATFAYDAAGVRVRKQTSAGVTRAPFAGYEIDPAGVVTKYLGGVAKKSTGAVLFYHNDHLGGVNVITDTSGTRVQLVEYDPWGQVSRSEGNADPTHRFTGKELDPETGLYYYGGRYYDSGLARFISADPFVPAPGSPQSLNRYSYVLNSPVNLVDPSGYSFFGFLKKLFRFQRNAEWEVFKVVAPIVVGIVVGIAVTSVTGDPIVGGFVGGAAAGAVSYGLNGGDPTTSILLGAAFGAIGGALGPELSGAMGGGWQGAAGSGAILGGAYGGISAAIYGGDVFQGIALGAVTGAVVSAVVYAAYEPEASIVAQTEDTGGTTVRVGARKTMEVASHKIIDAGDAVYEVGADSAGNIKVYRGPITGEGLLSETGRALRTDAVVWGPAIRVSGAALLQSIAAYESANANVPYRWYYHNSNYFVNTVVSAAGGNPYVPGVFAPPFGGVGGPTPAIPFVWVPSPALRGE
jgi:RHS repeat-associated protein